MTTKNRAIACYLPTNIEEKLKEYCHNEGITQSDGVTPKMGTAVIKILGSYFGILPNDIASEIPKERLEDMVKGIVLDHLPSTIPTFDEVVSPSQLDHRAASIIERYDLALAQLDQRMKALENDLLTQRLTKNSSQNAPKTDDKSKNNVLGEQLNLASLEPSFKEAQANGEDENIIDIDKEKLLAKAKIEGLDNKEFLQLTGRPESTFKKWKSRLKNGEKWNPDAYPNLCDEWEIRGDRWFRIK